MEHLDEVLFRLSQKDKTVISHIEIRNINTTAGDIDFKYEYKEKNKGDK